MEERFYNDAEVIPSIVGKPVKTLGRWSNSTLRDRLPDTTVEPSVSVVGRIQQNTNEGKCLLKNPSEMLKGSFVVVSCCSDTMVGQSCCCV